MKYKIDHKTTYNYVAPVVQSQHILHLSPREVPHQFVLKHTLDISPAATTRMDFMDHNNNPASIVTIDQEHSQIEFFSQSQIDVIINSDKVLNTSPSWEKVADAATCSQDLDVIKHTCLSRHTQLTREIFEYTQGSFAPGRPIHEVGKDLTSRIYTDFKFDNTATDVTTPISEVMKIRRGVCQDFAHLQIACFRALQLPARYVSGYILTKPPQGMRKLAGTDASHAWVSLWCGHDLGWIDFDPTNNIIPTNEHITFAYGADFDDVSPISGMLVGGGAHTVTVAVDVIPL